SDLKILDASGQYLIPGLMDSHVHISQMPGAPLEITEGSTVRAMVNAFHKQQPRSYLYFGVTQVLDPSQSAESIIRFNSAPEKPDLFHCGAMPIFRGYPSLYVSDDKAADIFDYILADPTTDHKHENFKYPKNFDPEEHTPEKLVAKMAKEGAICVKAFIEDGFGSQSHWPLIAKSALKRLKAAAEQHGLITMAHANAIDMQQIAKDVGFDVIAHGMWNWNQFDGEKGLPEPIKVMADEILRTNMTYQATFGVMDGLKGVMTPNILDNPLYSTVVSDDALAWYKSEDGQWFHQEMLRDYGGLSLEQIHARQSINITQGERVLKYLVDNNLAPVLASDTPAAPTYAQQPGLSTYQEILHMHKIGLSLKTILESATINNARAFGLESKYGTIEPGKAANLLVLKTNPLKDVSAYNSIQYVIINGKPVLRETLRVN
ncbi:MAG: amidohydrolase family protein, partial [Kangiellaceae bacterium]|nr:amidohydrolase family protein [Kangiellaceae bacterium]